MTKPSYDDLVSLDHELRHKGFVQDLEATEFFMNPKVLEDIKYLEEHGPTLGMRLRWLLGDLKGVWYDLLEKWDDYWYWRGKSLP